MEDQPTPTVSSGEQPQSSTAKSQPAPFFAKFIAILLFLGGILSLFLGVLSPTFLISRIIFIIIAIGLFKMKRWALYAITIITLLMVIALVSNMTKINKLSGTKTNNVNIQDIAYPLVQAAATLYFWGIYRKLR